MQTKQHAYAHHIQRLMITGNIAMLLGVHPRAVHDWYLAVYVDAFEWVELPNTVGMSQYADGGRLGSKPYAAGGNYVRRMSDYCRDCRYDVRDSTHDGGCPLNALYWHFINRNAERLQANPRMRLIVSSWRKRDARDRQAVLARAGRYLAALDEETESASRSRRGKADSAS
jgi:deoxyribodipyrimidine photolyase-related protein